MDMSSKLASLLCCYEELVFNFSFLPFHIEDALIFDKQASLRVYMSIWELFLVSAEFVESQWMLLSSHLPHYVHLSLWQSVFFLLPTLPPQAISKFLQLFSTHTEFTRLALSQCKGCNKPVHKDVWKLLLMIPDYAILSITLIS